MTRSTVQRSLAVSYTHLDVYKRQVGPKSALTFGGQSTYILKVEGKKDAFILMADIWRPEHPSDARYIWLPVQFKEGIPYVEWMDNWTLDFFQ